MDAKNKPVGKSEMEQSKKRLAHLVQVRWGALLHDIGRVGVPDNILLKSGPLADEE